MAGEKDGTFMSLPIGGTRIAAYIKLNILIEKEEKNRRVKMSILGKKRLERNILGLSICNFFHSICNFLTR